MGDCFDKVYDDFKRMIEESPKEYDLEMNPSKCKNSFINPESEEFKAETLEKFHELAPGIKSIEKEELTLLGSPVFLKEVVNSLEEKLENLNLIT